MVSVLGHTFKSGVVVCLRAPSDNEYPQFGEIVHVFVPDESKVFLVRELITESYCSHYNSYNVSKTSSFTALTVDELALHDVFHIYKLSSLYYITIRSCCHVELFI